MELLPDLVITNANVITMSPQQSRAEALAIYQGKFAAIGTTDEMESIIGPKTKVLNLKGQTVVPGFIDAHLHALSSGIWHIQAVDCDLSSILAIQSALRARVRQTHPGEWVLGFKFDDTKTSECRWLNRWDLDAVSMNHPIYVAHRGEHTFIVNSKALEIAGVTKATPNPPGGMFEHDAQTGELTGILQERAADCFQQFLPPVTIQDRRTGLRRICHMFNAAGLTSVHDALVTNLDLQTYQEGLEAGELTLRVYLLMSFPHFAALRDAGVLTGLGNEQLRIGGIKLIADGAIAGRNAWLSKPYIGSIGDYGLCAIEPKELEAQVLEIHKAGYQVCTHANGDAAIDMTLTAYEKAMAAYPRINARHRIEHCTVVSPSLLERIKKLAVIVTPFCTYVYYHGEKLKYYGEDRVQWMFAQRSFLDYGIISTGATDYIPGPFEPLLGIQSCVTRTDISGKVWGANQKITVEEALKLYTLNGAYASFEEHLKGSIEVGKLADLVVLGADPISVNPNSIKDIPVLQTIVDGQIVYAA